MTTIATAVSLRNKTASLSPHQCSVTTSGSRGVHSSHAWNSLQNSPLRITVCPHNSALWVLPAPKLLSRGGTWDDSCGFVAFRCESRTLALASLCRSSALRRTSHLRRRSRTAESHRRRNLSQTDRRLLRFLDYARREQTCQVLRKGFRPRILRRRALFLPRLGRLSRWRAEESFRKHGFRLANRRQRSKSHPPRHDCLDHGHYAFLRKNKRRQISGNRYSLHWHLGKAWAKLGARPRASLCAPGFVGRNETELVRIAQQFVAIQCGERCCITGSLLAVTASSPGRARTSAGALKRSSAKRPTI